MYTHVITSRLRPVSAVSCSTQ